MGIKGLNSWISSTFPGVMIDAPNSSHRHGSGGGNGKRSRRRVPTSAKTQGGGGSYDHVLIDANGIVHQAFRKSGTEKQVFRDVVRRLDEVFSNYPPRISAFVALDGVGPHAKMLEQRKRRIQGVLKSGRDEEAKIKGSPEYERRRAQAEEAGRPWPPPTKKKRRRGGKTSLDSLRVTPGTGFMMRLREVLRWYASDRASRWAKKGTIFFVSGSDVPGEGEIKIIEHLHHARQWSGGDGAGFLLVGTDADLLLLGLAAGVPRCDVLTSDGNGNDKLFRVNALRGHLLSKFRGGSPRKGGGAGGAGLYELDFLVIAFLQGNDYLPKIRGANPQRYSKKLANLLKGGRWAGQHLLNTRDGNTVEVNLPLLVALVKGGANTGWKARSDTEIAINEDADDDMEETGGDSGTGHGGNLNKGSDPNQYLICLAWCAAMYLTGTCPDYDITYKHKKSPTATELATFLSTNPRAFYRIQSETKAVPLPADIFSLCLLPAAAKEHVPFPLQSLMDKDGPLSDIFHKSDPSPPDLVPRITKAVRSLDKARWKEEDLMALAPGQISVFGPLYWYESGKRTHPNPFLDAAKKSFSPLQHEYSPPFGQNNGASKRHASPVGFVDVDPHTQGANLQRWAWDPVALDAQEEVMQIIGQGGDQAGCSSTPTVISSVTQNGDSINNQTVAQKAAERKRSRKASKKTASDAPCRFYHAGSCRFGDGCRFSHDGLAVS